MKTGHHAIQLHTYGPQPSTCIHLYVCMPNGSVLSVPGVCLPSGCIRVCLCPPTCQVRPLWERVAGHGGYLSCWVIRQLRPRLPTVYRPIGSVTRAPQAVRLNTATYIQHDNNKGSALVFPHLIPTEGIFGSAADLCALCWMEACRVTAIDFQSQRRFPTCNRLVSLDLAFLSSFSCQSLACFVRFNVLSRMFRI